MRYGCTIMSHLKLFVWEKMGVITIWIAWYNWIKFKHTNLHSMLNDAWQNICKVFKIFSNISLNCFIHFSFHLIWSIATHFSKWIIKSSCFFPRRLEHAIVWYRWFKKKNFNVLVKVIGRLHMAFSSRLRMDGSRRNSRCSESLIAMLCNI